MADDVTQQPQNTLGQSYIPQPSKAIFAQPTISRPTFAFEKMNDFTATFIRDNSNKNMGGIWLPDWKFLGGSARTGTGMLADAMSESFWKDYSARNRVPSASQFTNVDDFRKAIPSNVTDFLTNMSANPFQYAKTPQEAEDNMRNSIAMIYASESANNDPASWGYWGVGTVKFLADAVSDPSNWATVGFKAIFGGATKAAVGGLIKSEAKYATIRTLYNMQKQVEKQLLIKGTGKQMIAAGAANSLQAALLADSGVKATQRAFGQPIEGDPYATMAGAGLGAGFGVGLPLTLMGISHAVPTVSRAGNKLAESLTIKTVNKALPEGIPKTGKVALDADTLTKNGVDTAIGVADELAYQVKRLTRTPYHAITRWGNAKWWDSVKLSGWTPDMFLEWVARTSPNKDGIDAMLDQITITHIQRLKKSDGSFVKEISSAWNGMKNKNLRVANALVELPDSPAQYEKNFAWFVNEVYDSLKKGDISQITAAKELNELRDARALETDPTKQAEIDTKITAKMEELDKNLRLQAMDSGVLISARAAALGMSADEFVEQFVKDFEVDRAVSGKEVLFQGVNGIELIEGAKLKSIEVLRSKMRQPMRIADVEKMLLGNGVKKEELRWAGIERFKEIQKEQGVDSEKELLTVEDLENWISVELFTLKENVRKMSGSRRTAPPPGETTPYYPKTKYESYTFDEYKNNYQEIVFTTPDVKGVDGKPLFVTKEHFKDYAETPFVHARVSDFVTSDPVPKKFLRIHEIQSDILQAARAIPDDISLQNRNPRAIKAEEYLQQKYPSDAVALNPDELVYDNFEIVFDFKPSAEIFQLIDQFWLSKTTLNQYEVELTLDLAIGHELFAKKQDMRYEFLSFAIDNYSQDDLKKILYDEFDEIYSLAQDNLYSTDDLKNLVQTYRNTVNKIFKNPEELFNRLQEFAYNKIKETYGSESIQGLVDQPTEAVNLFRNSIKNVDIFGGTVEDPVGILRDAVFYAINEKDNKFIQDVFERNTVMSSGSYMYIEDQKNKANKILDELIVLALTANYESLKKSPLASLNKSKFARYIYNNVLKLDAITTSSSIYFNQWGDTEFLNSQRFRLIGFNFFTLSPDSNILENIRKGLTSNLPFKDSYYDLVIKRLVNKAAKEGYDGVQISSGNIISERYNSYDPVSNQILSDYDGPRRHSGYIEFYDRKYRSSLERTVKQYGGKIESVSAVKQLDQQTFETDVTGNLTFHQIEFDENIRNKVIDNGFYMFQQDNLGTIRAAVQFLDKEDGKAIITTFTEKTNVSSIVHEIAHIFEKHLSDEERLAARKALGIDSDRRWTIQERERFARSFEGWLRSGKTNNQALIPTFNRFKTWMTEIYKTLKGSDIEVNDELSDVFEKMLDPGYKPGGWMVFVSATGTNKEAIKRWARENEVKISEGLDLDTGTGYNLKLEFGWNNPEEKIQDLYRQHWKSMDSTDINQKFNQRIWQHYGKRLLVTVDASKLSDDFEPDQFIDGVNRLKNEFGEGAREKSIAKLQELSGSNYIFESPIYDKELFIVNNEPVGAVQPKAGEPLKMTVLSTVKMSEQTQSKYPKDFKSYPVESDINKQIKNVMVTDLSKPLNNNKMVGYANSGVDALFDESTGEVWYIKHLGKERKPPKTKVDIEMPDEIGKGLIPLPIDAEASMKKTEGRIRIAVKGNVNRGLLALFHYSRKGTRDFVKQAEVLERLRILTGIDDDVELIYRAVLLNDYLNMWVKRARRVLRADEKDKNLTIEYRKGIPVVDIALDADTWTKVMAMENLNPRIEKAMQTGKIPTFIRDAFSVARTETPIEAARRRLIRARIAREEIEKKGTIGVGNASREEIDAARKELSEAQKQMRAALKEYGTKRPPEIVKEELATLEKPRGEVVSESEAVIIMKEAISKSSQNWLVRNGWGKVTKALRKLGTIISTGHMETIGSQVPIIAHLSKFINSISLYNDAFEFSRGYKGIGLMQMKGNADAESGAIIGRIWEVMDKHNLAPNSQDEIALMQGVIARIIGVTHASDPKFDAAIREVTQIVDNYFRLNGDRGLAAGFFAALDDTYAGSFHIAKNMERVGDLTEAFRIVLSKIFTIDDASPLHMRTLRTNTGVYMPDGSLDPRYATAPSTVADLIPEHKTEYVDALNDITLDSNNIPQRGLYADAFFMTKNKLGHVEAKPLRGSDRGMRYTDPALQRRIYVEAFFEPELMPFVDWSINGIIGNYGERVAYRIREREAVNQLVFDLTGQRRRDMDLDVVLDSIESVLLTDSAISQEARDAIKGSFQYLRSKVLGLRGQIGRDLVREMGILGDTADVAINLARTTVSAASGIAGVFTEALPLIASVAAQTGNISATVRTLLKLFRFSSREELKGMVAGLHVLRSHMPGEIASMRSMNTLNRGWWDKNFANPIRDIGTAPGVGNKLKALSLALHRMASGLGAEEGIQASVSNAAIFADMYRFVSNIKNLEKLITLVEKESGEVSEEMFRRFIREAGFTDEAFAAQLNQAGFVNREVLNEILDMNRHSGGQLLDLEGSFMDYDLMVSAMMANPSLFRQRVIDTIQGFKQNLLDQRVTRPTITEMNTPSGGLSAVDRMYNVFLSYGRSWFSNIMLNNLSNAKLSYALYMMSIYYLSELMYSELRSVLYQNKPIDELIEDWENNPGERLAAAMARSNFGGNMTDIGHIALDLFNETGRAPGGLYPVTNAWKLGQSIVGTVKDTLSSEKQVSLKDAEKIENSIPGVNAPWIRALIKATGYRSFSEWILSQE